jgi:hypothetical protein
MFAFAEAGDVARAAQLIARKNALQTSYGILRHFAPKITYLGTRRLLII